MAGKLSEEELLECLKSLNVPARLSDINMPSRDFVIRVLDCFLKDMTIDITCQNAQQFEAIKHMENPDAFQDLPRLILLVTLVNKVTSADGLTIYIKDIMEPKPKRTRRILNHIIVFWKYCLRKNINFEAVEETLLEESKQAENLLAEITTLESRKEECLNDIASGLPSKEELESCVSSKMEKAQELKKQCKTVTDDYELVLKKKEQDLHTKNSSLDVEIITIKEKITEIEQLILPSPDRFNTDLQRLKDLIKNEEVRIRERELDIKDKKKRQESLKNINEHNAKFLEALKEIKISTDELNSTAKSVFAGNQKLKFEEEQLSKDLSELDKKKNVQNIHLQKEMQISLNTKKQKESLEETQKMLKEKIVHKQKVLETLKQEKEQMGQNCVKKTNALKETVNFCKQAESLTQQKYTEYKIQMEAIYASFMKDTEEVKEVVQGTFKKK